MELKRLSLISIFVILVQGCNRPSSTPPVSIISPAGTPQNEYGVPEHRIAIRLRNDSPEFFDRNTDQKFLPIGPNFHMLGPENDYVVDKLFAHYDPELVAGEMDKIQALGYTVIRTSLDVCVQDCIGREGGGLRDDYLDHVADFIRRAKSHGLFVILTSNDLPLKAGYVPRVEATCCTSFDGYMNSQYLSPVGVEQWKQYWQDVIKELIERETPLDAIMAYQIRGELFLFPDKPPLSLTSGTVKTANGKSYDMADAAQKQSMIDEGLRYWADTVSAGIHDLDPTALTVVGLFPPNEPNPWRADLGRYVPKVTVFVDSSIDFIDLHPYPGYLPLDRLMENYDLAHFTSKPLMIGEFGGFTFVYSSPQSAAQDLQRWQVDSCKYNIQGWMFWHWMGTNDHEVWTGSEADGAISQVLAPVNRPDPCTSRAFDFFDNNLAPGKPVSASNRLNENPAAFAVDAWNSTAWNSGGGPPQWIEIDLQTESVVNEIRLVTSQFPEGKTVHQIMLAGKDRRFKLVHEFAGDTGDFQTLEYILPEPARGILYVKIVTTQSPSWVAWREIEILGVP